MNGSQNPHYPIQPSRFSELQEIIQYCQYIPFCLQVEVSAGWESKAVPAGSPLTHFHIKKKKNPSILHSSNQLLLSVRG